MQIVWIKVEKKQIVSANSMEIGEGTGGAGWRGVLVVTRTGHREREREEKDVDR